MGSVPYLYLSFLFYMRRKEDRRRQQKTAIARLFVGECLLRNGSGDWMLDGVQIDWIDG